MNYYYILYIMVIFPKHKFTNIGKTLTIQEFVIRLRVLQNKNYNYFHMRQIKSIRKI